MKMTRLQFHIEAAKDFALLLGMAVGLAAVGALLSLLLQDFVRGAF